MSVCFTGTHYLWDDGLVSKDRRRQGSRRTFIVLSNLSTHGGKKGRRGGGGASRAINDCLGFPMFVALLYAIRSLNVNHWWFVSS